MKTLDMFGSGVQSYSAVVTAQRRLNCFYDIRADGDQNKLVVVGTPGTTLTLTLPPGTVRGWWAVGALIFAVSGRTVYSITTAGVYTALGTIATTSGSVGMADNGVEVIIVDGNAGYYIPLATGIVTLISDANFPNGATTVAFLNGRFFVEKPNTRQFYEGQSYAAATWTPVIFASKENNSDILKAVSTFNGMLILWGSTTMEFWQDTGTTPLTVGRINGATQTWGLAAVYSKLAVNNQQIFLGVRPEGGYQVAQLNGYQPVPISTSDIDAIINKFTTVADAVALSYTVYGHPMYQLTFPTAGRSFIYDTVSGVWSDVQTGIAVVARHNAQLSVVLNGVTYLSDYQNGNIYKQDPNVYTDNGVAIKRQVRTKHINQGGNRFGVAEIYLDMEVGVGLESGQGSAPLLMVQVSKDNGQTFGVERRLPIGVVGNYLARVVARRFGLARDFVFQFTMTDPVKFIIVSGSAVLVSAEQ